jgi:aminopeptidase N
MSILHPVHYRIHLEPDLQRFQFSGRTEIILETESMVPEMTLNALELAVWTCQVKRGNELVPCAFQMDPEKEELEIRLPEAMSGRVVLVIVYQGHINDRMAGFYRSGYVHQGQQHVIAVTQFEESDARRAFPCVDHPFHKATFDIEIEVDAGLTAVSNAAVEQVQELDAGRRRFVFERTPKMSTYLVFFGVGDFQTVQEAGDARVRVLALPGMEPYAGFGLEFGRKALEYSEHYYGIAYALPKLDLIAVPDFAFGAMENWGAITFRENLLLHYPGITSKSGEERICEVIAHEVAHQWFGNLVTPSDWQYLWLNESFATYFGYGIVNHYYPRWGIWDQFLHGQTAGALVRDALHENFPIEIPSGQHVVINASTAPIIYSKGGSILRQVHGYIGEDNFRNGLQHYLKAHAYECAASDHLWQAFQAVSGLPVTPMMKSWIEQPGFPLLEVRRQGRKLVIAQKRFTYLSNDSKQTWLVPVTMELFFRSGSPGRQTFLLEEAAQSVELPENTVAFKLNAGQNGFYRVRYLDADNLAELGRRIRDKSLSPEDRWGLQGDYYALLRSGETTLEDYLVFLDFYAKEDAFLPLISIATNLVQIWLLAEGRPRQLVAEAALSFFEAVLARIGYEPQTEEDHTTAILRDQLLWQAALLGSQQAADFGRCQFSLLRQGKPVKPDILRSVMQIGALCEGLAVFDWFDTRFRHSGSEHERLNILSALGCFGDRSALEKTLDYVLKQVPARNKFIPVAAMAANPHGVGLLWQWYRANLKSIEEFHPLLYERVITALVPSAAIEIADEVKTFFEDYMRTSNRAKDAIKLALEKLEINLQTRRALGA